MKNKVSELARLEHMLDAIEQLNEFTLGIDDECFFRDRKMQLVVARLFEILGEAANHVTPETKQRFSDVEWKTLYVVRNIVAHEYFGINYEILWYAIQDRLPALKTKLEKIITILNQSNDDFITETDAPQND